LGEQLYVKQFGDCDIDIREVTADDDYITVAHKQKYPFVARSRAILKVFYIDKDGNQYHYGISYKPPFYYDGATIPGGLCKGDTRLLEPALWHDLFCREKSKIGFNRHLSSLVFRELLLQHKVEKPTAQLMYCSVDAWQRIQKGWK